MSGKLLSSCETGMLDMMSVEGEEVWVIAVRVRLSGTSLYNSGLEARYPEITERGRQLLECSAGSVDAEGDDRDGDGDDSVGESVWNAFLMLWCSNWKPRISLREKKDGEDLTPTSSSNACLSSASETLSKALDIPFMSYGVT